MWRSPWAVVGPVIESSHIFLGNFFTKKLLLPTSPWKYGRKKIPNNLQGCSEIKAEFNLSDTQRSRALCENHPSGNIETWFRPFLNLFLYVLTFGKRIKAGGRCWVNCNWIKDHGDRCLFRNHAVGWALARGTKNISKRPCRIPTNAPLKFRAHPSTKMFLQEQL